MSCETLLAQQENAAQNLASAIDADESLANSLRHSIETAIEQHNAKATDASISREDYNANAAAIQAQIDDAVSQLTSTDNAITTAEGQLTNINTQLLNQGCISGEAPSPEESETDPDPVDYSGGTAMTTFGVTGPPTGSPVGKVVLNTCGGSPVGTPVYPGQKVSGGSGCRLVVVNYGDGSLHQVGGGSGGTVGVGSGGVSGGKLLPPRRPGAGTAKDLSDTRIGGIVFR